MFICGICHSVSEPREKPKPIPTKLRRKVYSAMARKDKRGYVLSWTPEGRGYEIEKEALVCRKCAPEAMVRFEEMKKRIKDMEALYAKEARAYKPHYRDDVRDNAFTQEAYSTVL